ncbi:bactofilin family protein [Caldanaerobacter sp.]|uniref:bactofilin family protein n=1 Tax=Caldanaerobacter sp. TaxID=2930036 RepID=UPI003C782941
MFQKKGTVEVDPEKIDTVIGKNTFFEGTIRSEGTLRIDGNFTGQIETKGNVIIGEGAKVEANISSDNVVVSGEVKGNILAKGQLKITSTGKVYGDIEVQNLMIEEGAIFDGKSKMTKSYLHEEDEKEKT